MNFPFDSVIVVGKGVFGLAAALELKTSYPRLSVKVVSPDPYPRPASWSDTRICRPDYGSDPVYTAAALTAISRWKLIHTIRLLALTAVTRLEQLCG